jgi:hypothetical protein
MLSIPAVSFPLKILIAFTALSFFTAAEAQTTVGLSLENKSGETIKVTYHNYGTPTPSSFDLLNNESRYVTQIVQGRYIWHYQSLVRLMVMVTFLQIQ